MARGQLLKTKVKELKALTKAGIKAQQEAEGAKDWKVSLREHIGKMIDRVDPLEVGAVLGFTGVIHYIIVTNKELVTATLAIVKGTVEGITTAPWWSWLLSPFPFPLGNILKKSAESKEQLGEITQDEFFVWLISFCLAFILIRHAGAIIQGLGEGFQGLTNLVKMFLIVPT